MDHREMIDYWVQQYMERGQGQTFTGWLKNREEASDMLSKIDLLDQVAGGWPQTPVTRDRLAERVDAIQTALNVWAESTSKLGTRVAKLERHAGPLFGMDDEL